MKEVHIPQNEFEQRVSCRHCQTTAVAEESDLLLQPNLVLTTMYVQCPNPQCTHGLWIDTSAIPADVVNRVTVREQARYRAELRREQDERSGMGGGGPTGVGFYAGGRLVDGA